MPARLIENPYYRPTIPQGATTPAPIAPYPRAPRPERRLTEGGRQWGIISEAFPSLPEDRAEAEPSYEDIARYRQDMSQSEYNMQVQYLAGRSEEFENRLGQLNQLSGRMDPIGRSRVQDLNKRADILQRAFTDGKINQLELFREMDSLNRNTEMYKWDNHVQGPGAKPGDRWEEDGYIMYNEPGKGPRPIDYTEDYRRKNTYVDNERGFIVIPTSPGKESKIMSRSEYGDTSINQKQEDTIRRNIKDQVEMLAKIYRDPITGELTKSVEEIYQEAANEAIKLESLVKRSAAKAYGREVELTGAEQEATIQEEARNKEILRTRQLDEARTGRAREREWLRDLDATGILGDRAGVTPTPPAEAELPIGVESNLLRQHLKLFKIPESNLGKATSRGYTNNEVIEALGVLNQMKHLFPNIESPSELPPEWQVKFAESYKVLKILFDAQGK